MKNTKAFDTLALTVILKHVNVSVTEQNKTSPLFNINGEMKMGSVNLYFQITFPDDCSNAKQEPSNAPNNTQFDGKCRQPEALIRPLLILCFQISDPS